MNPRSSFVPTVWILALCLAVWGGCAGSSATEDQAATDGSTAECGEDIERGAALGIGPIPDEVAVGYRSIFCKYAEVVAPNGGPIRIFAQSEISNPQLAHARAVLEFYLSDVPSSRYGSDKSAIANQMADNGATLLMLRGRDGEFDIFDGPAWADIDGQPLYEDETVVPGSAWYVENDFDGHRDATFEEILHLVHDTGIGVDVARAAPGVAPDFQAAIRHATNNALYEAGLWAQDDRTTQWIGELEAEGSLTQEYLAAVVDSYYGLWGPFEERPGGMWGIYVAKTREEIMEGDPLGYALMGMFFAPHFTHAVRLDPSFGGTFRMSFDPEVPYTHKSRYLVDVALTGSNHSSVTGNEEDNRLRGNRGDNALDGGGGNDTATFSGARADYVISREDDVVVVQDQVEDRDGLDRLTSIENIVFRDATIAAATIR